jgi:hypothetical protein
MSRAVRLEPVTEKGIVIFGEAPHNNVWKDFTFSCLGKIESASSSQGSPSQMYLASRFGFFLKRSCVLAYSYLLRFLL